MLGMVTISSRMRKAYLLGFTVPTAALPWLLMLIVYLFIPNTVFLCNVLAVITGQMRILFLVIVHVLPLIHVQLTCDLKLAIPVILNI